MKGEPEPPSSAPVAAVALILRGNGEPEVLLIERMEREGDPWSGQIALPGGRRDPRDASLSATVRREVLEEVSLDVQSSCLILGRLPEVSPMNVPQLVVFPFVYSLQTEAFLRAGVEVRETFWASLSRIQRSRTTRTVSVRGRRLEVPAFVYGGKVIWGLTYRILTALFSLGQNEV